MLPTEAHRLTPNGDSEDVPVTALTRGDRVLIQPGEKVPTDGVIVSGRSSTNEAMLTGESKPVERSEGIERAMVGNGVNGTPAPEQTDLGTIRRPAVAT